jgi:integrase
MPPIPKVLPKKKGRKYRNQLAKSGKFWWVCIKRGGKKIERSTRCTDRSDAELVRDKLIRQMGLGSHGIQVKGPFDVPTLEQAAIEWVAAHKGVRSPRYLEQMLESVRLHMVACKDLMLDEIDTKRIEKARELYLSTQGEKTLKGVTFTVEHTIGGANKVFRCLSALYGWAIRRNYISTRPWKLKEEKVQQEPRSIVWPEQVRPFLDAVDATTHTPNTALSIRLQIALGLRESETSSADWQWVSWRTAHYIPGKTKNRKIRQIPIPPWLLEVLTAHWEALGKPSRGLILKYGDTGDNVYRGFTKNAIRVAGEAIGIEGLHPHRLRATFATAHFETGTSLDQIMLMLGHEKPATTMRYIETRQKDAVEAQSRVAAAMGFPPPSKSLQKSKPSSQIGTPPKNDHE